MSVNQRVKEFLESEALSQKEFCQKTGYSENNLSNFLTGKTKLPRIDLLEAIAIHFPHVNLKWILTGEGEMSENRAVSGTKAPPKKEEFSIKEKEILYQLLLSKVKEMAREIERNNPEKYYALDLDKLLKAVEEM